MLDASNIRKRDPTRTSLQHRGYPHSTTCFFLVDIAKDNCLHADLYSQAQVFICTQTQVPDSTLMEVNPPRVYPQSKDCYQSQNTPPDSEVQQTVKCQIS
jgi:hypothetical protein